MMINSYHPRRLSLSLNLKEMPHPSDQIKAVSFISSRTSTRCTDTPYADGGVPAIPTFRWSAISVNRYFECKLRQACRSRNVAKKDLWSTDSTFPVNSSEAEVRDDDPQFLINLDEVELTRYLKWHHLAHRCKKLCSEEEI